MTFPEDQTRQAQPAKAPNYAVGMLLNVLLQGSGFTYINRWPWHLGWIVILFVLSMLGSVVGMASEMPFLAFLPVLGWIAHLVHYHVTYQKAAAQGFRPLLSDGVKIALIVGHLVIGFFMVGILSAVLIPNLLSARTKATQAAEQSIARNIYTQILAEQAGGKPLTVSCPTITPHEMVKVTECHVGTGDPQNPTLDVTFDSGRSVHLP